MKKYLLKALALMLVLCMAIPMMSAAAVGKTTYIIVSIEDDEGTTAEKPYRVKLIGESSRYLTEEAPLLVEVVAIINEFYDPDDRSTPMWRFDSPAMKKIMDDGLQAYRTGNDDAWVEYVDLYYTDVNPVAGDVTLKDILKDKTSTLGDIVPNVAHQISFKNEVESDPKYGVTYTVTVTRCIAGEEEIGAKPSLNREEHFAYINGYPDDTVKPNNNITREEATAIFYRLLTEESRVRFETTVCAFTDVGETRWSRNEIATMAAAGIVNGKTATTFAPEAYITRAEFAAIAARFDELSYSGEDMFADIAGHWAADEINQAASRGWVTGNNGMFRPDDPITRAEAVTLINRVLDRQPETPEDLLEGMIVFTDNLDEDAWYYLAVQEAANGHDYVRKSDGVHETWVALTRAEDTIPE